MKHPMVIKMITRRYRVNNKQVAQKLGENERALTREINSESIRINRMITILDALGYQLVFQPKGSETLPEWSYPIRWSDYNNIE